MPSPLGSNASAPTPGGSGNATANGSSTRASGSSSAKDFGQMLSGGTSARSANAPAKPGAGTTPAATGNTAATADGHAEKAPPRPADSEPAATDAAASTAAAPSAPATAADKDAPTTADDAPWPPLGLAGLVLAVPTGVDPLPVVPAVATGNAEDGALPAAATALPAAAAAGTAAAGAPATANAAASGDGDDAALPLPELVMGGKSLDRATDTDSLQIGDRAPPAPLQPPLPTALQDLKAALASNTVFNGEPTPKPVLGDDGFDQAIGARVGWLADQKIGHAHIRLNPEDVGPVDVRLQMNGDKVHASFSSPHVDVRQALESSLPRLRELLGEQGFQLAHADVGHQHSGGDAPGGQAGSGRGGDGEPSLGDTTVSASQLIRQRGLLDAYA